MKVLAQLYHRLKLKRMSAKLALVSVTAHGSRMPHVMREDGGEERKIIDPPE